MRTIYWVLILVALAVFTSPAAAPYRMDVNRLVPSTPTDLFTSDTWLTGMTLTGEGASDANCIIISKGDGRSIYGSSAAPGLVPSGSMLSFAFNERKAPGGITWSCDVSTVSAWVGYRTAPTP